MGKLDQPSLIHILHQDLVLHLGLLQRRYHHLLYQKLHLQHLQQYLLQILLERLHLFHHKFHILLHLHLHQYRHSLDIQFLQLLLHQHLLQYRLFQFHLLRLCLHRHRLLKLHITMLLS